MAALVQVSGSYYYKPVNLLHRIWGCLFASCFLWAGLFSAGAAESKQILLRNETIATTRAGGLGTRSLATTSPETPVSGLYLIQFTGAFQAVWRDQLSALGVELTRSIPEDAFVASLKNVQLGQLRSLPFVYWVGEYRPTYKVHSKLGAIFAQKNQTAEVRVLLTPKVPPTELRRVLRLINRLDRQSHTRFGNVMQGQINAQQLTGLAQSPAVLWIEPTFRPKLFDELSTKIVAGENSGAGANTHAAYMHELGYDGNGVTVAVADSGLSGGTKEDVHPDLAGRVEALFYYGNLEDASDEHSHGTHVTGIIAGNGATGEADEEGALYGLGVAPRARIVAQRLFDGAGGYEAPESFEQMTRDAVRAGADIGSNSWGDDTAGRYDISAMEFDALVRDADAETPGDQQYILEFSAGNAGPGPQTIGSPAVAKNVIATGASQNNRFDFIIYAEGQETTADFSSRGPCEDGRIKPDLIAPGTWIASLQSSAAGDENAWLGISEFYQYQGGTSQSGPHASGAAAIFVQYYREMHGNATPSPALVKAALINSAVDMDDSFDTGPAPNNDEGWGRIDLTELIGSERHYEFLDQTQLLTTGDTYEQRVVITDSVEPFKVTLTYTDVPGLPAAIPALVNDLDLEVVGPDGRVYRGNAFRDGESVANSAEKDKINNIEGVHIYEPIPGEYIIRVHAASVIEDARRDTVAVDQDFALVVSGSIPVRGVGVVILDRTAYTAPSTMQVRVYDFDLAGEASVNVTVKSSTETSGELLSLRPAGIPGMFAGTIPTALGAAARDNRLQIKHGDWITAEYQDLSPAQTQTAQAAADMVPPVLSNVGVTNRFGRMVISWRTDEPATSLVRYGANGNLSLASSNVVYTEFHEVALDNLIEGTVYQFLIASADRAGNASTNNNGGQFFTFTASGAATVLLVDAYVPDENSQEIPVTTYTDALDRTGVSYEVWNVLEEGSPKAADLKPFRVVMWRISDSFWVNTSISVNEQTAIQEYLNNGGSFFMASMEILSRVGATAFRTNVLQVQEFLPNPFFFEQCSDCDEDVGVTGVIGNDNDPITSGILLNLDYSAYPSIEELFIGPDFSDTFVPTTNAASILISMDTGRSTGVRYPPTGQDSNGRVVFFSFPLDTVPEDGEAPNNRVNLLRNALSFLAPGVNGLGTIALDRETYPVPGKVTVEVADSDLIGQGQITVEMFSDSSADNSHPVTLQETVYPGLFRGFITLIAPTNQVQTGQMPAKDGDIIRAEYIDASANSLVRATADVDTVPADITNVEVVPEYEEAVVFWETSEPTDATVQFGESTFLSRTAYRSTLEESHSLRLVGLQPDKTYYYQIMSRDGAGNLTIDDNDGQLYSLRTLKPLSVPWSDNFETPTSGWVITNEPGTSSSWAYGVPDNGMETEAHSPTHAWGSNLKGEGIEDAFAWLISPAIDLSGGNRATLSFWHSYDFTGRSDLDAFEGGELYITTNNMASWNLLRDYYEFTVGWEQEELDISAYTGKVVRFGWFYGLFTFESLPRPGWLIDDVSVDVSNLQRGRIDVANNLSQGSFTISGPISRTGAGLTFSITNAPPGQYVVRFDDVPFYRAPSPQTNDLAENKAIVFQGLYTFEDANGNGISDAWEMAHFNEVSPARNQRTDSDGDGVADYAEFIAGTNPKDPESLLTIHQPVVFPNGTIRLEWASQPGISYRVWGSTNIFDWTTFSGWLRANSTISVYNLPTLNRNVPYMFRLEVKP